MEGTTATREQLLQRIAELEARNAELSQTVDQLKAKVSELTHKLEESLRAGKRQAAPFRKGPPKPNPKTPGRKPNDGGRHAFRTVPPTDQVSETYEANLPESCPHCQGHLVETNVADQFQTEIPREPIVRKFRVHIGHCDKCGKRVQGRHPLQTSDALGAAASQIGPDAQAAATILHTQAGLSHGKVANVFDTLFGIKLTRGASAQIGLRVAEKLERKWHERYEGEVQTHYKSVREPGASNKPYMGKNWLKMYDKLGLMLRVETVVNQPGAFKIYRECRHRDGSQSKGWFPMCKGAGNLQHYQSHALACNQRYLDALAAVSSPAPAYEDLKKLTERQHQKGRSYAGFNPEREKEMRLFAAVLAGDHIALGFRNQDIRAAFYAESRLAPDRRKHSAAIGRLLKRLQVRGMVTKVPRSRRWRVTVEGRRTLGDTLHTYRRYQAQAA